MSVVEERQALFDPRIDAKSAGRSAARGLDGHLGLTILHDLAEMETVWRAFEATADCTAF